MKHLRFQNWVRQAVSRIVLTQDRITAGRELMDHMEDRYQHYLDRGAAPADAECQAIASMGDPEALSHQLGAIHRPFWGLCLQYSRRILSVMLLLTVLCLGGRILAGYLFIGGYAQPVYSRYHPYRDTLISDATGQLHRTFYSQPDASATSDGYTLTLRSAALWHGSYTDTAGQTQTDDYFYFLVEVSNPRPWADYEDILRWFWAEDDLGNHYYAAYESGASGAPAIQGSVYHTAPMTWVHDMYLTDFISGDAQWIDLHYDRAGRDVVLRIDLTGGTGA